MLSFKGYHSTIVEIGLCQVRRGLQRAPAPWPLIRGRRQRRHAHSTGGHGRRLRHLFRHQQNKATTFLNP